MLEFLMLAWKMTTITALSLLGLACIGYAIGYGFFNGKADADGNKYRLILPEVNVIHKTGEPPEEERNGSVNFSE